MRKINRHIVHCSDSLYGDVRDIRRWHLNRGWDDVGYHFIIRQDGEIEVGRTMEVIGAHAKGYNATSIGTCLIGKETFTERQMESLFRIHDMLVSIFGEIELIGHYEVNENKTCPNFKPREALGRVRKNPS